jgi:hypothetical protein
VLADNFRTLEILSRESPKRQRSAALLLRDTLEYVDVQGLGLAANARLDGGSGA